MIPRLVIAGTHSGVGKTTVSVALMAALGRRGLRVQGFKIGPDFIDPGFHAYVTGRPGRNLDGWMLSRDANLAIFANATAGCDIAIVEGVMGAYDGHGAAGASGSSVEMAKWLRAPVVLVVDASAMARSAAALVHGFFTFDPDAGFAGAIFNRVGSERHAALLAAAVPNLGALPRQPDIAVPERHLGMVMASEALTPRLVESLADWIEKGVDVDRLLALARVPMGKRTRIGVARDAAFCFYYQDNLDLLESHGAELVEFSPLEDARLPPGLAGLYFGGGYPELHAARLARNVSLMDEIRVFGGPIYAECGGFMYLTCEIVDFDGVAHAMVGLFPTSARMRKNRARLGYVTVTPSAVCGWLDDSMALRGHEFRYSEIDEMPPHILRTYCLSSAGGERAEGYFVGKTLGSYVHLHFASCPEFAEAFVNYCATSA